MWGCNFYSDMPFVGSLFSYVGHEDYIKMKQILSQS
jgi:hypothetical protein